MIGRRNIRVKVMQSLYGVDAMYSGAEAENPESLTHILSAGYKLLDQKIEDAATLFALMVAYLCKVAQYAEQDAHQRASKYLPSQEDLQVNTKLAGNLLLWETLDNPSFMEKSKSGKLNNLIDAMWVKKLYQQLANTEEYQAYIASESRVYKEDKKIMYFILQTIMLQNEEFTAYLEEEYDNWSDDQDMIIMQIGNHLDKPDQTKFLKFISKEKHEYAQDLLKSVCTKNEYLLSLIKPKLNNWDAERVATIDIILLKMGISEFLYFPSIPTKVTINEYIELAKNYSTQQSGQFVNGVLDNLLKELEQAGKVQKS